MLHATNTDPRPALTARQIANRRAKLRMYAHLAEERALRVRERADVDKIRGELAAAGAL
jgi:hypothetical protein